MVPHPRVLIVDDSPVVLAILKAVFTAENYDVVTASGGHQGFELALCSALDLLVTDSVMPGVDGFGLLRLLKAHPSTRSIPVIMLTSGDMMDLGSPADRPKPDAYAVKSTSMDALVTLARDVMAASRIL